MPRLIVLMSEDAFSIRHDCSGMLWQSVARIGCSIATISCSGEDVKSGIRQDHDRY
jgi:hypothetical protein